MTTDKQVVDSLTTQGKTTSQEEVPPQTIIGTFDTIESVRDAAVKARARVGFGLGNDILRRYGVKIADLPKDKWQEAGEWFNSLAVPIIRPCEAPCATFNEVLNYGHAPNAYARFAEECKDIQFKSASDLQIIPPAVDGGAEGIIRPGKFASGGIVPDSIREAIMPPNFDGDGPGEEDGPWAKGWEQRAGIIPVVNEVSGKSYSDMVAAEQRRQAVQAEAMVNLAVGVTMMSFGMLAITQPNAPSKLCGGRITITPKDLENFQQKYVVHQEVRNEGDFTIIVSPKGK